MSSYSEEDDEYLSGENEEILMTVDEYLDDLPDLIVGQQLKQLLKTKDRIIEEKNDIIRTLKERLSKYKSVLKERNELIDERNKVLKERAKKMKNCRVKLVELQKKFDEMDRNNLKFKNEYAELKAQSKSIGFELQINRLNESIAEYKEMNAKLRDELDYCLKQLADDRIRIYESAHSRKGDDLTTYDDYGTEIMLASKKGDVEKLISLLEENPSLVNSLEPKAKITPLHFSVSENQVDSTRILLERGADVNARNISGDTPLHIAVSRGYLDVIDILVDFKMRNSEGKNNDFVGNIINYDGNSALHVGVLGNQVEVVDRLIKAGADIQCKNARGYSPLHVAAQLGFVQIGEILIRAGADVNCQTLGGVAPIHRAVDHKDFVDLLLRSGANINVHGQNNSTPLHLAAEVGCLETCETLIEGGADPNAVDLDGKRPIDLATEQDVRDYLTKFSNG